jgi:intracellular septation protein
MLVVLRRLPIFPLIASTVTVVFGALTIITHDPMWVQIKVTIFNALFAAFLFGGLYFKRNFFKYVFEKTFHYTEEGWDKFTWNFAWFFVFTAFANEAVRLGFKDERVYDILGLQMDGVGIWIAFKVALIMPLSGLYAYYLTRLMQRHRIPEPAEPVEVSAATTGQRPRLGATNGSGRAPVSAGERSGPAESDIREINHG